MSLSEAERKEIQSRIKVWKTIVVGGKTKEELLAELGAAGVEVTYWARVMMESGAFTCAVAELVVDQGFDLVNARPVELGFGEDEQLLQKQVFERVALLGGMPCPFWLGPFIRAAYLEQDMSSGEVAWVYMEPISVRCFDSHGNPDTERSIFGVASLGGMHWFTTGTTLYVGDGSRHSIGDELHFGRGPGAKRYLIGGSPDRYAALLYRESGWPRGNSVIFAIPSKVA